MRITIVTPSYNQGKFIRQTLENVLVNQDYKDIEHLVIDGGSSDETLEILKTYIFLKVNLDILKKGQGWTV